MTLAYKQYPTITEGAQTIVTPLVSEEIYVKKLHGVAQMLSKAFGFTFTAYEV